MEKENLGKIFSEVSEISENSEFSTLPSEFRSLWIALSVVLCLLDRKVRLMVNDLFYSPGSQKVMSRNKALSEVANLLNYAVIRSLE